MAQQQPKSRPEAPAPEPRTGNPQPASPVYGDQWGRSGKQNTGRKDKADERESIERQPKGDPTAQRLRPA